MATDAGTVDELLHRLRDARGRATARKMFGEYCVYLDGRPVALVCDDTLFVKLTPAGRAIVPDAGLGPPYAGAKPHLVVPLEDARLAELMDATLAALPAERKGRR